MNKNVNIFIVICILCGVVVGFVTKGLISDYVKIAEIRSDEFVLECQGYGHFNQKEYIPIRTGNHTDSVSVFCGISLQESPKDIIPAKFFVDDVVKGDEIWVVNGFIFPYSPLVEDVQSEMIDDIRRRSVGFLGLLIITFLMGCVVMFAKKTFL